MRWNVLLIVPAVVLLAGYRVWRLRKQNVPAKKALGFSLDREGVASTLAGILISTMAMCAVFFAESLAGLISIVRIGPAGALLNDLSTVVLVPLIEEFVNRVAVLGALMLVVRRTSVAVVISAIVFGVMHAGNQHASVFSVISTIVSGLVYGIPFAATERIWLPFGLHMGWNWAQGRLFGFAVSGGQPLAGFSLIQQIDNGPALLTGGAYGPEGGVIGFMGHLFALALVVAWLAFQRRSRRESAASARPA